MSQRGLIIFVAVLASLLEIIDTSIVNVAIPTMMGNLGATLDEISMIITGYAIANAIVLPVSAWLSERMGRRKYFLGCIALFTATSVACGFAPNLETLIVFRIFQGLAGGALLPTSQAMIYEQFPKEKAGMAGAIFGMSVMIGPTLGPVMGGYLTDEYGWRSIFNVNLPLGIIAFLIGSAVIFDRTREEGEAHMDRSLDAVGLALLVAGIGALQYVLERGEANDWFASSVVTVNAIIAAVCLPVFIWWETKVKNPIINVRLFLNPIVQNGVALMAFLGLYLYGIVFLLPVFAGRAFHYDATQTGSLFIPGSLITAMLMPLIGKLLQSGKNPKFLIAFGLLFIEFSLFSMTWLSTLSSREDLLMVLYIRGIAMGFIFVPLNSSVLSQFKGATLAQVSGMMNLFRQLGGSVGIAVVGTLLTRFSAQNYLDLSTHVNIFNDRARQVEHMLTSSLPSKMANLFGMGSAHTAALRVLMARVQDQVFMLSFNQLIWILMAAVSLSFIPLVRLRLGARTKVVDAH